MNTNNRRKIALLSLGVLFLSSVGVYGSTYLYKNYQETQLKQTIEQHKKEQIEQAKDKLKKVIDDKISGMNCKAKYDLKNSSNNDITFAVSLDGRKNTNIDCKFDITEQSIDFDDETSFENAIDKFINEEKITEIRHTAIYDYQDILYGMASKDSRIDKVKFSQKDEDYTVQETSNRFWNGYKAYLVIIDSEWLYKNGDSEWKQIWFHMEYDKNDKLIDAKYYYGDIDPNNDIKNTTENINNTNKTDIIINQNDAKNIVKKKKNLNDDTSIFNFYSDLDKIINGVRYYYIEVTSKGGHGASLSCYVNSKTGEEIDVVSNENKFNEILNSK